MSGPGGLLRVFAILVVLTGSGLLFYTAYAKVFDQPSFARTLASQGLLPARFVRAATIGVPIAEFIVGASCFLLALRGGTPNLACVILAMAFVAFALYAMALHHFPPPKPVGCGCGFSQAPVHSWLGVAARNGAAAAVLGGLALIRPVSPTVRADAGGGDERA